MLLKLPMIFPQTTVSMAKLHFLLSVGTSVQVALVWLVVVGQLPQFNALILYWTVGQSGATGLQLNVICLSDKSRLLIPSVVGVKNGPIVMCY